MADSTIRKTKNLTRDTLPLDSSAVREDTKQTVSAAHQDKPGYMGHGIAKMETDTCQLDVQENIQTGSLKDAVIDIKEEVRDLDSEFPEQFEDISREKCYSSHEIAIADVRGDTDIEVDFHGQVELFNRDKCVSDQEMFMTYTQGDYIENSSALTGKENHQNIKNHIFEHKTYGIKVKEEFMENDAELQNCLDVSNTEESFSPLESILKNVKRNVKNSLGLVKITNIITCNSAQAFNNNLVKKEEPEDDEDGSTENETSLPIELSQTIEKTVSEENSNAVIKDEKIEIDRNLHDDCIHLLNHVDAKDITDEKIQKLHKCNVCNKSFRSKEKFTGHMKRKIHQKREFKCEICDKDLKVQNSEKYIKQELNKINVKKEVAVTETYSSEQLEILNNYHCYSDEKITITDVKGAVTDNETDFLGLVKITNIKTCDSAQAFNNTLVKKEEPEDDVEFLKHFETTYREQSGSVDKIISNVNSGKTENETNLPGALRSQTVEKSVSEPKSNPTIVKVEKIEIYRNLPDNSVYVLNQVSAKDITEEKTQKLHICKVCNKRFRSKEKFTRHIKRKNHQKREFKCEICNKVFYRNKNLNLHMNVHTKKKVFKCKFCDKILYHKASLSEHLKLHTKAKEYKCEICDKVYFLRTQLTVHTQSHLSEEQRSCKFCGKLFSRLHKLKVHLNIHTKEKEFKCDVCDKVYFLKSALTLHMQSHLSEEQRSCKFCGKLFSTRHSLKRHLNLHTKEKEFI